MDNKTDFAHLMAAVSDRHELLCDTDNECLVHSLISGTYYAEVRPGEDITRMCREIKRLDPDLLITTNEDIFGMMKDRYEYNYPCIQFVIPDLYPADANIRLLKAEDLEYVKATYHCDDYVQQLFDRDRFLGYYIDGKIIGYGAYHIDGSVGAVYVDPLYRGKGYGKDILKATVAFFDKDGLFAHVLTDNTVSIKMFNSVGAAESVPRIYWMHRRAFSFEF